MMKKDKFAFFKNFFKSDYVLGIIGSIGIILFSFLAIRGLTWCSYQDGFFLNLQATYVADLEKKAPVRLSGTIPIGFISDITQGDLFVYVKVFIFEDFKDRLYKHNGIIFQITSSNVLGVKYINLTIDESKNTLGTNAEPFKDGDSWFVIEPASPATFIGSFLGWSDIYDTDRDTSFQNIILEIESLFSTINSYVTNNEENLKILEKDFDNVSTHLGLELQTVVKAYKQITQDFSFILEVNQVSLDEIFLVYTQLAKNLDAFVQYMKEGSDDKKGSLYNLLYNKQFKEGIKTLQVQVNELLTCIKENPSVLFLHKENCIH